MWNLYYSVTASVNDPHQSHESSSHSNEWRHRNDDQGQLPALYEAHEEATGEGGEALNKDSHLIRYGVIYLIDITVKVNRSHRTILGSQHTDAYVL